LRILTFTGLFPHSEDPSYGIFIYQRSAHLAARSGNVVEVVAPVPYFPRWLKTRRWRKASALPSQEMIGVLRVHHPRYFLLPKVWMPFHAFSIFLGCLRLVAKLNREAKFDCIDAHFVYPDGMAAVLLGKVLRIPVTVSARGSDINLYPEYLLIRPMIQWTLKHADNVIAVSAALKNKMLELGASASKIHVIPNGVDERRFHCAGQTEAREKLNLPVNAEVLIAVGALIPAKGHQLLIRAFAQVAPSHPGLQLHILGEGSYRQELEELVRELGLKDKVQLTGKRPNEELQLWFNAADFSCLASEREGWPNVITESLACGTPVVATRVGGIPEIIHKPELGVLVEQTVESIASGLEKALSTRWDREAISKLTRERTWEAVGAEVEAVLAQAIQKKP
jgi:teichuronic acid biosynthesis glycosyltransferase TuaC